RTDQLRFGEWNQVVATYDGSRRQYGLALYVNGLPATAAGRGSLNAELLGDLSVDTPLGLGGTIADLRLFNRVVTESEAYLIGRWTAVQSGDRAALLDYYLFL